jgi:hypothetical protein
LLIQTKYDDGKIDESEKVEIAIAAVTGLLGVVGVYAKSNDATDKQKAQFAAELQQYALDVHHEELF